MLAPRMPLHRRGVEHPEDGAEGARPADLAGEEHVAGDVERRRDGEGLVDGLDPGLAGLLRAAEGDPLAVDEISPASGTIAPDRHLIRVDLPAPLSPMTASTSPA